MRLVLPATLGGELIRAARAAFPQECCGLVAGLEAGGDFFATALHPARNLADAPDRFEINPADHIAAAKLARSRGYRIIGCYHSHPNGQKQPSPHDLSRAEEENFLWLIAVTDGRHSELAAFVYRSPVFEEIILSGMVGADLVTSSSNERS